METISTRKKDATEKLREIKRPNRALKRLWEKLAGINKKKKKE